MFRKDFAALALVLTATRAGTEPLTAARYTDFDHYILALSWQTRFCQNMLDHNHSGPEECRLQQGTTDKIDFLIVHSLWPELPKSIAAHEVDERRWIHYGCTTRLVPSIPEVKANRKCQATETGLSLEMTNRLNNMMPGSGDTPCLGRCEYAKHGVCFGFDPDSYLGTMMRLSGEIRHSPVGDFFAKHYGRTISRADFDAAVAHTWSSQSVKAFKLTCNGNPAYLTEMQISFNAATINAPLATSAFLPQPHPGNCGTQFILDKVGQWRKATC